MRRLTASVLAALTIAVAFQGPARASARGGPCFAYTADTAPAVVEDASAIVVGVVAVVSEGQSAVITPEAYLKGATLPASLRFAFDPALPCEPAELRQDDRVLAIFGETNGVLSWPGSEQVFVLRDGSAIAADGRVVASEQQLVDEIRSLSGQFSVPAGTPGEGASLDWLGTVLPVTAAVLVVFAIALVLMREWHRIDPT